MKAIVGGTEYLVKGSDWTPQSGMTDPGMTNAWTVFRNEFDEIGYGILIDLGIKFGYRLVLRDNYGRQKSQEFTRDQVVLVPDN